MNVWSITGNIGGDCEVRYSQSGQPIASFSVAVSSGYGEKKKTTWVKCLMFGKRAESGLVQYLTKGQMVGVTGETSLNEWTDKDGNKRSSLELVVATVDLLGDRKSGGPESGYQPSSMESDLPF